MPLDYFLFESVLEDLLSVDLALPASTAVQLEWLELAKERERKPEQGFGEDRRQTGSGTISTQVRGFELQAAVR